MMSLIVNKTICNANKHLHHINMRPYRSQCPNRSCWGGAIASTLCVEVHHTLQDGGTKETNYDSVTSHMAMTSEVTENHVTLGFSNCLSLK
jgi:hypothetical protein